MRRLIVVMFGAALMLLVNFPAAMGQESSTPDAVSRSPQRPEEITDTAQKLGIAEETVAAAAVQQSEVEALAALARELHPGEFAGLWYDEALELQVAFTTTAVNLSDKVDSLQGQAQLTSTPRVRLVTYSLQQLEQVQTDLERDWVQALEESTQPSPLDTVSYIDLKESQNTLVLGVDDPYAPESLELLRTYGAMISLRATGGGSARACNRANCLGESFRAGLEVEAFAGGQLGLCTSGFRFEGGVSGPGFLVAGHCAARDTQVKHAGDVVGDVLYQGVFQQSPADVSYVSWNDGYFGMGRPERWVFRNFADRRYPLSSTGTGGVEGSPMCLTGSVGNTRCGGVVSTDISVREVGTGIVFTEQHTMNGCAKAGDSGGPVFYSNVGHGIVAGVIINNTTDRVCIDETYFGTVEHIEGLYPVDVLP